MQREGSESSVCEKIRDFGVKRVGRRGEMGRKWSKSPSNSGRLTFYKTAVLSQVLVLSIHVALFSSGISHYLVPRDQQQAEGQRFMWQEAEYTLRKACDPLRNKLAVFNQSIVDS